MSTQPNTDAWGNAWLSDENLMAFADGQLNDHDSQVVEQLLADNEQAAQKVQALMSGAAWARRSFGQAAPVPPALQAAVQEMVAKAQKAEVSRPAPVQPAPAQATPAQGPSPAVGQVGQVGRASPAANTPWYALAATVACVAVGVLSYMAGVQQSGGAQVASVPAAAMVLTADAAQAQAWQRALSEQPSGQLRELAGSAPAQLKVLATLRDGQGRLCREFNLANTERQVAGVACHGGPAAQPWQLQFAAVTPTEASGYTPASSAQVLDAYVTSIGAGEIMSAQEEQQALAAIAQKP
jgi:anti-sigma factor RsiW